MNDKTHDESTLVYLIGQLLDSPVRRRTRRSRDLTLVWRPGPDGDWQELVACRRNSQPSPAEDEIVMACLKTAAKKRGLVAAYTSMTPQVQKEGWGATLYRFKLAKQLSLL
jgi:hypothetical protein